MGYVHVCLESKNFFDPKFMIIIIRLGKIRIYPYQQQEAVGFNTSLEDCEFDVEVDFADIEEVYIMLPDLLITIVVVKVSIASERPNILHCFIITSKINTTSSLYRIED